MVETLNALREEIETRKKEYKTDSYSMSIGELVNLYRDEEIIINPEFQRLFRWDIFQKTSLIESILLGIPIPPIFVYQTEDGKWELVDGLQRVSTLLEFMGMLKEDDGNLYEPSQLVATEQLSQLKGITWRELPQDVRLEIKRARITVEIIKKESDKDAKYEVFQRLNANGSHLSEQEIRNSLLVMINRDFFIWLKDLANNSHFQICVNVSEKLEEEQYYLELILRYLSLFHFEADAKELSSISDFITQKMKLLARDKNFNLSKEQERFNKTFRLIELTHGKNTFKRYDAKQDTFVRGLIESVYDPMVVGIAYNIDSYDYQDNNDLESLKSKIKNIWSTRVFKQNRKPGIPVSTRLPRLIPFAKEYFKKNG